MTSILSGLQRLARPSKAFILVFAIALAAGCAVTPEQRAAIEPQAIKFAPKEGVLIVKASSNRNIGTFFEKWQELTVFNQSTGEKHSIINRSPPYAGYSLYVGALPAGTYFLSRFGSSAHGYISINSWADLGPKHGRFLIEEGKVTDLGTILYLRPYYPTNTRLYRLAFSRVPFESQNVIASLDPAVAVSARKGALDWLVPIGEETRPRLVKSQVFSMFLNDPHPAETSCIDRGKCAAGQRPATTQEILFGEALGMIARRDSEGRWSWLDTGTLNTILSLHVARDGTLYAGTDQSLILAKSAGADTWTPLPFPLHDASVRFIGEHPDLGGIVVAQDRRNIVVLSCPDLKKPVWTEMRRIPVEMFANPAMDTKADAFMAGDSLVVVTRSVQFTLNVAFHVYDIKRKLWHENPIERYSLAYSPMPDGSIYSMSGANISQNLFVTRDWGKTWEKRDSPNWMGQPVFRDTNKGYGIRIESIPAFDPSKLTNSFWKTADGGRTWTNAGPLPNQSARLIQLPADGNFLLMTYAGQLYLTRDDGVTWKEERSVR
ncbi:MAG: hypothetical protein H6R18_1472 [Proteobacteria bacterium]|nr:hypothetical protein [Pseudomonadota bacterium]